MDQGDSALASSASEGGLVVDPYRAAIARLQTLKSQKRLSEFEFCTITSAACFGDVLREVEAVRSRNEQQRSTINRFLLRASQGVLRRLDRFGQALDVLAQSQSIASLLWGSMRIMVIVGKDVSECFDLTFDALEKMANTLPRLEVYQITFDITTCELLQTPLTRLYSDMLEYCIKAIELYRRPIFRSILGSIRKSVKKELESLVRSMTSTRDEVDKCAMAQHMLQSRNHRQTSEDMHQITQGMLRQKPPITSSDVPGVLTSRSEEAPSMASRPTVFEVPGLLSVYFTGREQELESLVKFFEQPAPGSCRMRKAVIHGMAGIGKSQLALKFAESIRSMFSAILWTSGVNRTKISQGYSRFADLLDLPEKSRIEEHVRINAVKRWLSGQTSDVGPNSWLLLIDNIDKDGIRDILDFLPPGDKCCGCILFTTRSHEVAARLVGSQGMSIELRKMDPREAAELLLSASEIQTRDESTIMQAESVAASVGSLPLVLDQLAFIVREAQGNLDLCVEHVMHNKQKMLAHQNFNPSYHESSVTATYEAAFRKLEEDEPDAALLFSLLSFFDPEYIATDILTNTTAEIAVENPLIQVLRFSLNFERSVSQLRQFSVTRFLQRYDETRALWIHDLVQEMYRTRMDKIAKTEFLEMALTLLHACFPEELLEMNDPATWKNYEKCMPHVVAGIKRAQKLDAQSVKFARLCRDAGWFLFHKVQYDRAVELAHTSLPLLLQHYGMHNDEYISAVNLLAAANHSKGEYSDALKWYSKVLTHRQQKLGTHGDTINTMHNIALCLHEAGDFDESQHRFEEVVSHLKADNGPSHELTLCSEMSMARNMRYRGELEPAEALLRNCRQGLLEQCGPQHIWSLVALAELASVTWRMDSQRWQEAERMHREALAEKIVQLGKDHIHTWDSYADLGYLLWKCGPPERFNEAENLMLEAFNPYMETLTISHSQTKEFHAYLMEYYRETGQGEKYAMMMKLIEVPTANSPTPNLVVPQAVEYSRDVESQDEDSTGTSQEIDVPESVADKATNDFDEAVESLSLIHMLPSVPTTPFLDSRTKRSGHVKVSLNERHEEDMLLA